MEKRACGEHQHLGLRAVEGVGRAYLGVDDNIEGLSGGLLRRDRDGGERAREMDVGILVGHCDGLCVVEEVGRGEVRAGGSGGG